jgi:Tol biopolymer transport system component
MPPIRHVLMTLVILLVSGASYAQDGKKAHQETRDDEPALVITPHTIRVQATDPHGRGYWIVMPGFSELGSPTFSRDGLQVAFDAYKQGYNNSRPECWTARRDGTALARLTTGATPRWSPDGKQLLFVRGSDTRPQQEPDIYIINADGTGERKLRAGRWPDWSPDGKRIAFSQGGIPTGGARVGARVFICDAQGAGSREIAAGDCPSWSPDGKSIACCYREANRPPRIRIVDVETKRARTAGVGWFRANWMPDGKFVVANGFTNTYVMVKLSAQFPNQPPTPFFSQFEEALSPCPSSDGQYVVFLAKRPK